MGLLVGILLVLVVIALRWGSQAQSATARLVREMNDLQGQLEALRMHLASLRGAVRTLEQAGEPPPPEPVPHPAPAPPAPRPPLPVPDAPVVAVAPPSPPPPPAPPAPALPSIPHASTLTLEQRIGARWTTLAGAVVLLLATGFFLRWSIQRGLLGPSARVLLGLLFGVAMLSGGVILRRRRDLAYLSIGMAGFGLGALYLSLYAAHARYALISPAAAFLGMTLSTLAGAGVSVWSRRQVTAVLAILGGLLTPILVSTAHPDERVLLTYLLLLDLLALVVARYRDWMGLNRLAWVGSVLLLLPTFARHPGAEHPVVRLLLLTAVFSLFLAVPLLRAWIERQPVGSLDLALVLSNAAAFVAAVYVTLEHWRPGLEGPAAWALAAVYLVVGARYRARVPQDEATEIAHFGAAATLFAAGVPLLFDGPWVTLTWAVQGVALLVLATRTRSLVALAGGPILLCLAAARVAWLDRLWDPMDVPLANVVFVVHVAVVACLAVAGRIAPRVGSEGEDGKHLRTLLWAIACVLAVHLLWREPPDPWPEPLLAGLTIALAWLSARYRAEPALLGGTGLAALAALAQVTRAMAGVRPEPPLFNLPFLFHLTVVAALAVAGALSREEPADPPARAGVRACLALGAMALMTALLWAEPPGSWPVLLLAVEALAVAALVGRLGSLPLRVGAAAVGMVLLARVLWERTAAEHGRVVWNAAFLFELLAVLALVAMGALLSGARTERGEDPVRSVFWLVAVGLLALLLWQEPVGIWPAVLLMLELLAVATLTRASADPALLVGTVLLAATVLARVLLADGSAAHHAAQALWNGWLAVRIAACAALALAGSLLRTAADRRRALAGVLHGVAAGVLLLVLSVAWVDHQGWRARLSAGAGDPEEAQRARWLGQVGLSVLWTLYAAALLAFGFVRARALVRYAGLALLGVVCVKVLAVDLSRLDAIYRILSFAVLGVVLFAVAFFYQRASAGRRATDAP